MKSLYLLDGHALVYRAYYAFIKRPMSSSKGVDTSAIYGFTKTLIELIRKENPTHLMVAFDPGGKNFRHEKYPLYKANRPVTPEVIRESLPIIKEIIEAFNIPVLVMSGYEADDVIGTVAKQAEQKGYTVYMVTPDKDYGQLVSENIFICKPQHAGDGLDKIGVKEICAKYDIQQPQQVIDVLALWGDASDNVPGVDGVGEVRARKMVAEFGSVENILQNTDKLPEKQRLAVEAARTQLPLSKELITIDTRVPVEWSDEQAILKKPNTEKLKDLFKEYEFTSLMRTISDSHETPVVVEQPKKTAPKQPQQQLDLFGQVTSEIVEETSNFSTISDIAHTYHIVQSEEEINNLLQILQQSSAFCFDTETTGVELFQSSLVGISFSVKAHEAYYLPLPNDDEETKEILAKFKSLFEQTDKAKIGQNIKFDILMLKQYGINVDGFLYDTMIMHYLIEPESRHNMTVLCNQYLNYQPVEIEELIGKKGAKQGSMRQVPLSQIAEYAGEDADVTWQLKIILEEELQKKNLLTLYKTVEAPLIRVLADMEFEGIKVDVKSLEEYGKELQKSVLKLDEEIKILANEPTLNISSPKQLGVVLFDKLQLNNKAKKTKTKQYSTDEETLQTLINTHPIVAKILEFRSIRKLLSTYIEALPELVNKRTGKIHTTFNQFVTSTGRLSSNNPNLQNIPIRDESGREIRKAFIASNDEHLLISADYSQIELRLMAHFSGDPHMLEAFQKNEDIHTATAAKIFHVPLSEVTREQRGQAKTANFGIIYGISVFGLAQRLQIPRKEAETLISGYFATYPDVKQYMDNTILLAHQQEFVSTLFGRVRHLRDINSRNAGIRGYAERFAINAPLQGSAADIIKIAMINIHNEMQKRNLKSRMILQVHDELVLDVYKPELDEIKQLVQHEMEQAAQLKVPLVVEIGIGNNWLEAH